MLDQHLWSTFHVARAVLPGMLERGWGRIVAVTVPFVANPAPKGAAYAVSKAADKTLIRTIAREVADTGVTANLVIVRKIDVDHERETAPSPKNASWTTPDEIAAGDARAMLGRRPRRPTARGSRWTAARVRNRHHPPMRILFTFVGGLGLISSRSCPSPGRRGTPAT